MVDFYLTAELVTPVHLTWDGTPSIFKVLISLLTIITFCSFIVWMPQLEFWLESDKESVERAKIFQRLEAHCQNTGTAEICKSKIDIRSFSNDPITFFKYYIKCLVITWGMSVSFSIKNKLLRWIETIINLRLQSVWILLNFTLSVVIKLVPHSTNINQITASNTLKGNSKSSIGCHIVSFSFQVKKSFNIPIYYPNWLSQIPDSSLFSLPCFPSLIITPVLPGAADGLPGVVGSSLNWPNPV